jgi:hypothetical protein
MLRIGISKKSQPLKVLEYILVNWVLRNNDIYLENFKYIKEDNSLTFESFIMLEMWKFKLTLPVQVSDVFYLTAENEDPCEEQKKVINDMNMLSFGYEYDEYILNYNKFVVDDYDFNESILSKMLKKINDACSYYEPDSELEYTDASTSTSDYEEPIIINHAASQLLLDEDPQMKDIDELEGSSNELVSSIKINTNTDKAIEDIWNEKDEYTKLREQILKDGSGEIDL